MKTTSCDETNLMNYRCALFLEVVSGGLVIMCVFWTVLLSNRHENGTKVGHSCSVFLTIATLPYDCVWCAATAGLSVHRHLHAGKE